MSSNNDDKIDPRQELLAAIALGEIDPDEMDQLNEFPRDRDEANLFEFEKTAAALHVALDRETSEMMPEQLRRKIVEQGLQMVRPTGIEATEDQPAAKTSTSPAASPSPHAYHEEREQVATIKAASRISSREVLAWAACALAIFIALGIWQVKRPTAETILSAAQARSKLISEAVDLVQVTWADGKTPIGKVTGDVIWSNQQQTGFMRFLNLPINDPTKEQYQLWIIDPARDDEPIDGGVFNVTSSGESIVPIQAKLQVLKPSAFAITIEKPGGVVVSTQEKLPLIAVVK